MPPPTHRHGVRVVFPPSSGERSWRSRERDLAVQARSICAQVRELLGEQRPHTGPTAVEVDSSWQSVTALADECVERLSNSADRSAPWARRLGDLVSELYELGLQLCDADMARLDRRLGASTAGLRRLRTVPHTTDLLGQVCQELVDNCGFGRAGLSRVDNGFWRPWTCFQSNGHEFVESWFPGWVDQPIPIGEATPEIASVTDRRPIVVHDTATTTVYRPITIEGGRTISYVVAPVVQDGEVVGFLHADHCPSKRRVDDLDGEVLGAFTDGFSHVLEAVALVERLRAQRDQVREILAEAVSSMDLLCGAHIELSPWAAEGSMPSSTAPVVGPVSKLSSREVEVYELIVAGATNGMIANKLVIAEDTVKSHVKHILRKLGAANRSQVIAGSLLGDALLGDPPPDQRR